MAVAPLEVGNTDPEQGLLIAAVGDKVLAEQLNCLLGRLPPVEIGVIVALDIAEQIIVIQLVSPGTHVHLHILTQRS